MASSTHSHSHAWPKPDDEPALEDLAKCVHCGLCLNACPTYLVTGLETESPRGRISLARAVHEEEFPITAAIQGHWELCLQCRACEAVCPSGVPYGRIMEHTRAQLGPAGPASGASHRARRSMLRNVVANPRQLRLAVTPGRWIAGSGPLRRFLLAPVARRLGRLGTLEAQLPRRPGRPVRPGAKLPQPRAVRSRAVLFTGCIMGELFGGVHRATARVFARAGIALEATTGQGCCGALHAHDGDLDFARDLARHNIDGLEASAPLPIVVNSAGCGAAMKEYGQLLAGDPHYAARAAAFAARVVDATEPLAPLNLRGRLKEATTVAYQDACHLAHAQRIREQPRKLLDGIANCTRVETAGSDTCCGAAGIYSLVQPEMSAQLRSRKAAAFAAVSPDVIVTANPGCQMQYESAVRQAGLASDVLHIMELLDRAGSRPS